MKQLQITNKHIFVTFAVVFGLVVIFMLISGPPRPEPRRFEESLTILYTAGLQGKIHPSTVRESVDGITPGDSARVFMNISRLKAEAENRNEPVFIVDLGNSLSGPVSLSRLMGGLPAQRLMAEFPNCLVALGDEDYLLGTEAINVLPETIPLMGFAQLFPDYGEDRRTPLKSRVQVKKGEMAVEFFCLPPGYCREMSPDSVFKDTLGDMQSSRASLKVLLAPGGVVNLSSDVIKTPDVIIPGGFHGSTDYHGIFHLHGTPVAPPVDSRFHIGKLRLFRKTPDDLWQVRAVVEQVIPTDKLPPGAVLNVILDAQHRFSVVYRGLFVELREGFVFLAPGGIRREDVLRITGNALMETTGAGGILLDGDRFDLPDENIWGSREILALPGGAMPICLVDLDREEIQGMLQDSPGIFFYAGSSPYNGRLTVAVDEGLGEKLSLNLPKNRRWPYPGNFILLDALRRRPLHYYKFAGSPASGIEEILEQLRDGSLDEARESLENLPPGDRADGLILTGLIHCRDGRPQAGFELWEEADVINSGDSRIKKLLQIAGGLAPQPPEIPEAITDPPWPLFRGDKFRRGQAPVAGPSTPLLRWKFDTGSKIIASAVIDGDGSVYFGAEDRHLYALDSAGRLKWKFATGLPIRSTPAIAPDGTIYFGSDDRHFYAVTPEGKEKWKAEGGFFFTSSPLITGDMILTGCEDGHLYAFNPDGSIPWKFKTDGPVFSSPATAPDGTIYVGSQDHHIYAVNPDGSLKWKYQTGHKVNSSPAVGSDGRIYAGSEDRYLYCLSPDGNLFFRVRTGNYITSSPALSPDEEIIYVGSEDRKLWAISRAGEVLWKFPTRGEIISSPTVDSQGFVYVGSDDGILYCLTPAGELRWKFMTRDPVFSSPAMGHDGTLYVGSEDGNIYAVGK